MAELDKVCDGYYSVYKRLGMYCFIRPKCAEEETLLKEKISLEESFILGGKYVFCTVDDRKDSEKQFIKNVEIYFRRRDRPLRFLWIENPEDSPGLWKLHFLVWDTADKTAQARSVMLERYRLMIESGTSLTCQGDLFYFEKRAENALKEESAAAYYLEGPDIRIAGCGKLCLETAGDSCGAFCGTLVSDDRMLMQKLDAGICFSSIREESEDDAFRGFIHSAINPVLFPESGLRIKMQLAAHALLDEKCTCFHLSGGRFTSSFSSTLGRPVRLEAEEDAALVFLQRPVQAYLSKDGGVETKKLLYLGISGHFKLLSDISCLLCGLTGTENLKIRKEEKSFYFAPFMPGVAPYGETSLGTASWVGISGNVNYCCQPEASALYTLHEEEYMRLLEIPEAKYTDNMPPVPMMPYRNIRILSEDNAGAWENEIYCRRREILTGRPEKLMKAYSDGEENTILSVSQQGIMAQTDTDGNFMRLGLANVSWDAELPNLRFHKVNGKLREEFMQKQFSYVINTKEEFEKISPSREFDFSIEGVRFELLPDKWITGSGNKNTLMLLKYSEVESIREVLAGNKVFEETMENACTAEGEAKAGYEEFLKVVENPGFQGLFVLNARVSVTEMPASVKVLMKTIAPEDFYAAYLSIQSGRVIESESHLLCMERAEISGLIDYKTDKKLVYKTEPPDYDYLTREIKIEIAAGRLCSFTSSSEVLVNRLFGARADAKENPDGNCLVLSGKLVEEEGVSKYQYTLAQKVKYELYGSGIESVFVENVDLTANKDGNGIFTISGSMASREITGADLLGFGGKEEEELNGIAFSSLFLSMPKGGNMAMDDSRLVLDSSKTGWRKHSFPALFAVSLQGFVSASDSPQSLGYQPISAPVTQSVPAKCWQGFRWKIALGNQGALASQQTALSMELLTAFWETQDNNTGYYLGIKLPDALAGQETSLQGIMRMGFENLSIVKIGKEKKTNVSEVTEASEVRYVIKLHNYHVSLLGLSFPHGNSTVFLFSDGKTVGWYGAYTEKEDSPRKE